jgi:hypothetical protein
MPLPDLRTRAFVPAVLGACLLTLTFTSAAAAAKSKTVGGDIRVVDAEGRTLAQQTQFTGSGLKVKSDKGADCFGDGTGGTGKRVEIPGFTALSQLADAGSSDRSVKPLSITDHFDFGLGLCGVGRAKSPQTGFWYLKVNHESSQVGGDQTPVKSGDDVLWYLIDDFTSPTPDELALSAPAAAKAGGDVPVKVVSYDDGGKRRPAAGVTVEGADRPTDAKGKVTVPADEPMLELTATREGSIPSNTEFVCTQGPAECPDGYAATIGGSKGKDRIKVGPESTTVYGGGGDDRITATKGRYGDVIKCGAGKDLVKVSKELKKRSGFSGCERVRVAR